MWSLKGREIRISIINGEINDEPIDTPIKFLAYQKKDIEMLRQVLIEHIEKYFEKLSEEYKEAFDYIALDIIDIINKGFGVEENIESKFGYEIREEKTANGKVYAVYRVKGNTGWFIFKTKDKEKAEKIVNFLERMEDD